MNKHNDDNETTSTEDERRPETDAAADAAAESTGSGPDESEKLRDQLQRAMADLQNMRKRHVKERDDARTRALEGLATELLPVLDNFELALAAHQQGPERVEAPNTSVVEGVRMVRSLLQSVLERHGLQEIPALGEAFDPNIHEAMGIDPEAEVAAGHVSRVLQTGYRMGERVIRAARVMVAPTTNDPNDPPEKTE